ncbi:MAG: 50S ribosomal protein L10 [Bacteroidales bacterium]|jgi:large subunit ribosomal protein L10|nr:50S ribosomal protein L10 [Bacteroidales bacterium]
MKKEEKRQIIDGLVAQLNSFPHIYITDISGLNAADTGALRRLCFDRGVKLVVAKNTLLKKALEQADGQYEELYEVLKTSTSVMFSNESSTPAKLIREFRKSHNRPTLKAAYVEESSYVGENQLEVLATIKSKNELIGDIVLLLQSPAKNVVSALQSGKNLLAGLVKTLSERE